MREVISLDGRWKFLPAFDEISADQRWLDPDYDPERDELKLAAGLDQGWIAPGFDDAGWLDIPVPASWNKAVPQLWSYEGHGWYRRRISIPEHWRGRRVFFHSEGANYRATVYVNGQSAGTHDGGYLAFAIPVEAHLQFGGENVFAVSCDNLAKAERVPGGAYDWWNHGGLYRSVSLQAAGDAVIDDVTVVAAPERRHGRVRVEVLARSAGASASVTCTLSLSAPDGHPIALAGRVGRQTRKVVDGAAEFHFDVVIEDAARWSPDHPHLYSARVLLRGADGWEDERNLRFGLRSIEIRGCQLLLNGEPLLIKGVNRYEDYPTTGRSLDESYLADDLARVKRLGANTIRCHFPNHRRHYELCDEMGILNLVEVPLYHWGRRRSNNDSPQALEAAKLQLAETIRNLKHHPCVFMWSVSNENLTWARSGTPEDVEAAQQTARGNIELVELAHRLDPTRPVVEVSNCWPQDPVLEHTDVCAVNAYAGVEGGSFDHGLPALAAEIKRRLTVLREKYPDKPILIAEFGVWSVKGLHTAYFPGEEYQAAMLCQLWTAMMEVPGVVGGIIWSFADADVHRRFAWVYELHVAYGLFDFHREPKAAAAAIRELWAQKETS